MNLRFLPLTCVAVLYAFATVRAGAPATSQAISRSATPDIVYRSDETDATAQGLSNQPEFSGCGYLYNGANNELGTGTAIAANWVLTAKHVVTGYTTATFHAANGQVIAGTVYTDTATDMALIQLNSPLVTTSGQSYTPVALITPNLPGTPKVQPVGPLIWNVGYGNYGTYGGTVNDLDLKRRGGTNVVDSYGNSFLYFSNNNTSGTEFECSTGPGDSGGPMYLQTGYQWRVAAEVYGAGSSGFQDTDVSYNSFISTTTGISFAPQAAPASLTWNATYLSPSSAASKNITSFADGAGNWDTTRLDFVGATSGGDTYTYAWQNGTLLPVTFGHGTGAAGTVTVTTPINISDVTFAATGSGSYTLAGSSTNTLTLAATGSSITVASGITPTVSAPLAGTGALTKAGVGTLTLGGANTFTGGTNVNAGTLALSSTGTLGPSGAISVASGATLDFTALGRGGYTVPSGSTLTDNGTVTGTLVVSGTLQGTGTVTGVLSVSSGGLVTDASGTLTASGSVVNNGTIRFTGGAIFDASAATSFTNNGVLDFLTGNVKLPSNFMNGANGTVLMSDLVKVKSVANSGSAVTITIDSYGGHTYQLQRGASPSATSFANLGSAQNGSTGTTLTFTDSSPLAGQGFYRVTLTP